MIYFLFWFHRMCGGQPSMWLTESSSRECNCYLCTSCIWPIEKRSQSSVGFHQAPILDLNCRCCGGSFSARRASVKSSAEITSGVVLSPGSETLQTFLPRHVRFREHLLFRKNTSWPNTSWFLVGAGFLSRSEITTDNRPDVSFTPRCEARVKC